MDTSSTAMQGPPSRSRNSPPIERCASCALPKHSKVVRFCGDSECLLCAHSKKQPPQTTGSTSESKPELEDVIDNIRRRGTHREYDCLVGLSGGRDSSYLIYLLAKKYGLRCLSAYYRTPFTPNVTHQNVARISKRLRIEVVPIDISRDFHLSFAKKFFAIWRERPLPEIANLMCAPCKFVNGKVFEIARAHKVPTVVWGGNPYEDVQFLPSFQEETADLGLTGDSSLSRQVRRLLRILRRGIPVLIKCPSVLWYLPTCIKASLLIGINSPYLKFKHPDIHRLEYFQYTDWDEKECEKTIQKELGWELPPGCISSWRSDCTLSDLKNYMFKQMTGVTYVEAMWSNLIRSGKMDREEAIEKLSCHSGLSWDNIRKTLKTMDLPESVIDEIKEKP
ncbi:hypothetical protein ES706_04915 [subsurface metagenome]